MFMYWNGYPSLTRNSTIKRLKSISKNVEKGKDDRTIKWMRLPTLVTLVIT